MVPEAVAALTKHLGLIGNASSLHASGRAARSVLEDAREQLAEDLGAHPTEVVFTSGGTEADNLAIQGSWRARPAGIIGRRDRLVTSAVEHPAVADTMAALGQEGADVAVIGVDADGVLDLDALTAALATPTQLTSVMWVNNETGTLQPIPEVVEAAKSADSWVHSDAVQAVGHVPVNFADSGLDLLSVSAHKVGGPIGIGALLVRRELPLRAYAFGGGQEREIRSGTAAPALAAACAAAVHRAIAILPQEMDRFARLTAQLREAGRALGGVINGPVEDDPAAQAATVGGITGSGAAKISPAIVNISFPGARADDVLLLLDAAGIDCSTGSACTAGVHQPSPVLLAMGRTETEARESLRFSFGWNTTPADISRLISLLPEAIEKARLAAAR